MILQENKRLIIGVLVLLLVNIIWVLSSELTNYIFIAEKYNKPFLTTYLKSSLFSLFLFGFICSTHWKMLACPQKYYSTLCFEVGNSQIDSEQKDEDILSEPTYVLINYESSDEENTLNPENDYVLVNSRPKVTEEGDEEDEEEKRVEEVEFQQSAETSKRTVKFCKYKEVRHISETYAEESLAARMSYSASRVLRKRMVIRKIIEQGYYPASHVIKLAAQFCFCWFIASYAYQKSLSTTLPAVVNVISSTSSLFTLILAAIFPSSDKDAFSITKLFIVFLSIAGVVLISFSESLDGSHFQYSGIIWSLVGALGYAVYLVNLRRVVKHEQQMSLPMFLGFVGVLTVVTLWPGFFLFSWTNYEVFEVPNGVQIGSVLLNGVLGTVGAELLWLWGCFLTSSLTATVSMGLTIPLSMLADYLIKRKVYHWVFYLGSVPILVAFLAIAYLTSSHCTNADPLGSALRRLFCPAHRYEHLPENDSDSDIDLQSEQRDNKPPIDDGDDDNSDNKFLLPALPIANKSLSINDPEGNRCD